MFVLATKLDLNVNDMREMLENSMKENCQKFDDLSSKLGAEVEDLTEKIRKLEEENKAQTERISRLEAESSRAAVSHGALETEVSGLKETFTSVVLGQHGARLAELEEAGQELESRLVQQKTENINTHGQTLARMETMERELGRKVEETAELLTAAWTKQEEENKAALGQSLAALDERLERDERRLSELNNTMETNIELTTEYQQNNDHRIKVLNDTLMRFVISVCLHQTNRLIF